MNVKEAYNIWAEQYDTNENKTRDLEGMALRKVLSKVTFDSCLEIGCGTGKNTQWLLTRARHLLAVDFSDNMLEKAKQKIRSDKVSFVQADIQDQWLFATNRTFDMVTFSLVLEHIEHLDGIFAKLRSVVQPNGHVYIGELHPFKQYQGTKARFEKDKELHVLPCFMHHLSDFTQAALQHGFTIVDVDEHFDDNDRNTLPRILTLLLKRRNDG